MQTPKAKRWLAWEQIDLPCGAFRIQNPRWLMIAPNIDGWLDWTGTVQINEEIRIVLQMMGETVPGEWLGFGNTVNGICHGIAWQIV